MSEKEPQTHWIIDALKKEWPAIKKFFVQLACFVAGAIFILFLYEKFIIPGKDSTIVSLQQEKEKLNSDLQREDRENDKLRNDNAAYQAAHADKSSPLKTRAQILARQLAEFGEITRTNENDYTPQGFQKRQMYDEEWQARFEPRIKEILGELDVQGQFSDKLPVGVDYNRPSSSDLKMISGEINKLSDGLPETPSQ